MSLILELDSYVQAGIKFGSLWKALIHMKIYLLLQLAPCFQRLQSSVIVGRDTGGIVTCHWLFDMPQ